MKSWALRRRMLKAVQQYSTKYWKPLFCGSPFSSTYSISDVSTNGTRSLRNKCNISRNWARTLRLVSWRNLGYSCINKQAENCTIEQQTCWSREIFVRHQRSCQSQCETCGPSTWPWCCHCDGHKYPAHTWPHNSPHMTVWSCPQPVQHMTTLLYNGLKNWTLAVCAIDW